MLLPCSSVFINCPICCGELRPCWEQPGLVGRVVSKRCWKQSTRQRSRGTAFTPVIDFRSLQTTKMPCSTPAFMAKSLYSLEWWFLFFSTSIVDRDDTTNTRKPPQLPKPPSHRHVALDFDAAIFRLLPAMVRRRSPEGWHIVASPTEFLSAASLEAFV